MKAQSTYRPFFLDEPECSTPRRFHCSHIWEHMPDKVREHLSFTSLLISLSRGALLQYLVYLVLAVLIFFLGWLTTRTELRLSRAFITFSWLLSQWSLTINQHWSNPPVSPHQLWRKSQRLDRANVNRGPRTEIRWCVDWTRHPEDADFSKWIMAWSLPLLSPLKRCIIMQF